MVKSLITNLSRASDERVFHTLDALRGVAALGVVVFHLRRFFAPIDIPGGYLAVDLFFMMSGVVLARAYAHRFRMGMTALAFMRTRFIRLYPLYILGIVLGLIAALASWFGHNALKWDISSLLLSLSLGLLMLPNLSGKPIDQIFPLDIPCWSLFFEVAINIVFGAFWRQLTTRRLIALCLLTGSGVAIVIARQGNIDQGSTAGTLFAGFIRVTFGFFIGVLIAKRLHRTERRQSNLGFLALIAVVVISIAGWPAGEERTIWDALCVLVIFPLTVYGATRVDPSQRLQRIATFLGVTSYAIYVLHNPISTGLNSAMRRYETGADAFGRFPYLGLCIVAALLLICWLIDRYFDMPVRRFLSRSLPGR